MNTAKSFLTTNLYLTAFLEMNGIFPITETFDPRYSTMTFFFEDTEEMRALRTQFHGNEYSEFVARFQALKHRVFREMRRGGGIDR